MRRQTSEAWKKRIANAQALTHYTVNGKQVPRIKYGDEGAGWGDAPCNGCGVERGQFHVPDCEYEKCPVCGEVSAAASGHTCDIEELREDEPPIRWWQGGRVLDRIELWMKRVIIGAVLAGLAYVAFLYFSAMR